METRKFVLKSEGISYEVKKHAKSKSLRLHVYPGGRVLVTIPRFVTFRKAQAFAEERTAWIKKNRARFLEKKTPSHEGGKKEYKKYKEEARAFLKQRVAELNDVMYRFPYKGISVRNQKTRWGSCSSKGNLNFHYKILFLPESLQDYIIVHELCHLKELNHSEKFWNLVSKAVPDYKMARRALRNQPQETP